MAAVDLAGIRIRGRIGITMLHIPAGCFNGITILSLVNFGRTALGSRVSMQGYGQPRSRAASPRDADSVLVRYQEVAAIFIRACPCPAICALGL